jgi:excisionase family DNA binding protein
MERFLTAQQLAPIIGLKPRTIAKMAREHRIPAHPVTGTTRKRWRFDLEEVQQWFHGTWPDLKNFIESDSSRALHQEED